MNSNKSKSFPFNPKSLATKINIVFIISIFIVVATILGINFVSIQNTLYDQIATESVNSTQLLEYEISKMDMQASDDAIVSMIDALKEHTKNEFTIFYGDVRKYTTITQNGTRVVGTQLDPQIADIVINQGKSYIGEANILGENHLCSYEPYYANGQVVGVLFSGRSTSEVFPTVLTASINILLVAIVLVVLAVLVVTKFVKTSISSRLKIVVESANQLAIGNFSVNLNQSSDRDEIGVLINSFNTMNDNLTLLKNEVVYVLDAIAKNDWSKSIKNREAYIGEWVALRNSIETMMGTVTATLRNVSSSANQINGDSQQVAEGAQHLAAGSEEQSASIETVSATLNNISKEVANNLTSANRAAELAVVSGDVAKVTMTDMQEMQAAMSNIAVTSEDISKIVKVIEDIAFKTNILALNASVEAARAGSVGAGFAVVADEVRNLAQMSSEAASDITGLIDKSIVSVNNGIEITEKANTSFAELADKVQEMVEEVENISRASSEQTSQIESITKEVGEISFVIHNNTATSEESAAASEQLAAQADVLNKVVSKFKL